MSMTIIIHPQQNLQQGAKVLKPFQIFQMFNGLIKMGKSQADTTGYYPHNIRDFIFHTIFIHFFLNIGLLPYPVVI